MKEAKVYWVARNRVNGKLEGGSVGRTPHLYLGLKAAMAAKRGYNETTAELLERYDFIPVRLEVVNES